MLKSPTVRLALGTSTRRYITTTPVRRVMPLFICHLPDYPGSLERRLSVREKHLERAGKDKADGVSSESWFVRREVAERS